VIGLLLGNMAQREMKEDEIQVLRMLHLEVRSKVHRQASSELTNSFSSVITLGYTYFSVIQVVLGIVSIILNPSYKTLVLFWIDPGKAVQYVYSRIITWWQQVLY
jgi:hypothetical protein